MAFPAIISGDLNQLFLGRLIDGNSKIAGWQVAPFLAVENAAGAIPSVDTTVLPLIADARAYGAEPNAVPITDQRGIYSCAARGLRHDMDVQQVMAAGITPTDMAETAIDLLVELLMRGQNTEVLVALAAAVAATAQTTASAAVWGLATAANVHASLTLCLAGINTASNGRYIPDLLVCDYADYLGLVQSLSGLQTGLTTGEEHTKFTMSLLLGSYGLRVAIDRTGTYANTAYVCCTDGSVAKRPPLCASGLVTPIFSPSGGIGGPEIKQYPSPSGIIQTVHAIYQRSAPVRIEDVSVFQITGV